MSNKLKGFTLNSDLITILFDVISIIYKKLPSLHCNFGILLYLCNVFQPEVVCLQPITTTLFLKRWNY